jgi:hypothetical protein
MSTVSRNTELLQRWRSARPKYKSFVEDGVLHEEAYLASSPRIAVLLKEGNDDFRVIAPLPANEQGWGPKGSSNNFWPKLNIVTYLLTEAWHGRDPSIDEAERVAYLPVRSIAYINIKKNFENKCKSVPKDIMKYAKEDAGFIREQFDIVSPDIVYCGGTSDYLDLIDTTTLIENGVRLFGNRPAIAYYHPAKVQSLRNFFDGLRRYTTSEAAIDLISRFRSRT